MKKTLLITGFVAMVGIIALLALIRLRGASHSNSYAEWQALSSLHVAASAGDVAKVRDLLRDGDAATPTGDNLDETTPMHWAALNGHLEVLILLEQRGGQLMAPDREGRTPLHYAAVAARKTIVEYIVAKGVDVNTRSRSLKYTPLDHASAGQRDLKMGFLLRDLSPDQTEGAVRVLPAGNSIERTATVKLLLERGADIQGRTEHGYTPLHCAAMGGDTNVTALLLEWGADVHALTTSGWTPLHYAVLNGPVEAVKLLHVAGADLNAKANDGEPPLIVASRSGRSDTFTYLQQQGCPLEVCTPGDGCPPLHYAALVNNTNLVELILRSGVAVDQTDHYGNTALHHAAFNLHEATVTLLLTQGASPNSRNNLGETPAYDAVERTRHNVGSADVERKTMNILRLLIEKGGDVNIPAHNDRRPIDIASGTQVVRLLRRGKSD